MMVAMGFYSILALVYCTGNTEKEKPRNFRLSSQSETTLEVKAVP